MSKSKQAEIYKLSGLVADKFPGFLESELKVTGQYMRLTGVDPALALKTCERLTKRGARVTYRDGLFTIRACRELRVVLLKHWVLIDAPEGTPEVTIVEPEGTPEVTISEKFWNITKEREELLILDSDERGTLERFA